MRHKGPAEAEHFRQRVSQVLAVFRRVRTPTDKKKCLNIYTTCFFYPYNNSQYPDAEANKDLVEIYCLITVWWMRKMLF